MLRKARVLILAVMTATVMLLGSTAVFAADADGSATSKDPTITKTVNVAKGVTIDSEVTFQIDQVANFQHDGNTFTAPVTGLSGTVTTSGLSGATSDTGTKVVTINNILSGAGILSSLTAVGEYTFKITEKTGDLSANWTTKDNTEYYLQVIVKSDDSMVYSVTEGSVPATSSAANKKDLEFENTFTKKGSLEVKKTISTGSEYVDANKKFEFTVTFSGSNTATVEQYTATGATVTYEAVSGTGASSTVTGTFKLKKDETVTFENVPVGVTYTVTETTPTDTTYKQSETTVNEEVVGTTETGTQLITETADGDKVVVDNQYKEITPTGLIISYLPYIAMILLAIAALALYVVSKRRRAARY